MTDAATANQTLRARANGQACQNGAFACNCGLAEKGNKLACRLNQLGVY